MFFGRSAREIKKLIKFVIIGSTTFLIQAVLYFIFSRWLMADMNPTLLYALAVLYSLIFNYAGNRAWTFGGQETAKGSAFRYVRVALMASAMSAGLFWLGHEALRIFDLWVLAGVNLIIPIFTFIMHRIYTFHAEPHRIWRAVVRSGVDSV
ncbi:MAG TPA: GtrA family protein [bacterium]|nr:MAG: GtrA-like protein [Parcubacteria group bacterium ADurb.Bin192]HPN15460.1 GtrA family protein [bacterium]